MSKPNTKYRPEYQRQYRKNNPEKAEQWEYNRARSYCARYEAAHPDAAAEWERANAAQAAGEKREGRPRKPITPTNE